MLKGFLGNGNFWQIFGQPIEDFLLGFFGEFLPGIFGGSVGSFWWGFLDIPIL